MEKNPKACEPCRRRKIRCDGKTPCNRCDKKPSDCTYRLRTRVRKSNVQRAAAASGAASVNNNNNDKSSNPNSTTPEACAPHAPLPTSTGRALSPSAGFSKQQVTGAGAGAGRATAAPKPDAAYSGVYQSVAAANASATGREWTENSRLFYGPASAFAFQQQVHRGIISSSGPRGQQNPEVQEGGASLDLFLQRSFFFGTASRVDTSTLLRPASSLFPEVSLEEATVFLDRFKGWTARILPFFTDPELDKMLHDLYSGVEQHPGRPSQTRALTLAVLALGALCTPHTNTAEMLLVKAKFEAVLFDDTVSLQMIQFSMLLAEYHTGMGRPNLVYLCVGTACRKAFALGLHREAANCLTRHEDLQKYRTTLWCLYSLESWYSVTVGRESSLKMADISSPYPVGQPLVVSMSRLAYIAEETARAIYTQRYNSLRKLHAAAEAVHAQLRDFADRHGITSPEETSISHEPASLILHNRYYNTVLLTFRPFLVADHALAVAAGAEGKAAAEEGGGTGGGGACPMWLRQACRTAIDSAQDGIVYAHAQIRRYESCRLTRYNGYFLESACAVLFFDILRHPSKYPYDVEYINMALQSLDSMIDDEPVTNARNSIRQILRVVEATISRNKSSSSASSSGSLGAGAGCHGQQGEGGISALTDPLLQQQHQQQQQQPAHHPFSFPSPASFLSQDHHQHQQHQQHALQFPSLNAPEQQLIYFPDLGGDVGGGGGGGGHAFPMHTGGGGGFPVDPDANGADGLDPLSHLNYDVLATDLYSFFSLNMTPPSATGSDPAAAAAAAAGAGAGGGGMGGDGCPVGRDAPGSLG